MVLKELIYNSSYFGRVWKELIYNSFYQFIYILGQCGGLEKN